MRKLWPGLVALLGATLFGVAMAERLPEQVITHWGMDGRPDGWSPRWELLAALPGIAFLVAGVLVIAPRIDPKRKNFAQHAGTYWLVGNLVLFLVGGLHVVTVGANLGWGLDVPRVVGLGLGALFTVLGNVMTRVRPNWIFGIRTPWTLSSERSWRETHRVGGYAFALTGLVVMGTALLAPTRVFVVLMVGALGTAALSVVWSWMVWRRDPATAAQREDG